MSEETNLRSRGTCTEIFNRTLPQHLIDNPNCAENYSKEYFQIMGKDQFWNLSTSKPKSWFCVGKKSSFSRLDFSINSVTILAASCLFWNVSDEKKLWSMPKNFSAVYRNFEILYNSKSIHFLLHQIKSVHNKYKLNFSIQLKVDKDKHHWEGRSDREKHPGS